MQHAGSLWVASQAAVSRASLHKYALQVHTTSSVYAAGLFALQARLASLFMPPVLPSCGSQLQSAIYAVSLWKCHAWLVAYSWQQAISSD